MEQCPHIVSIGAYHDGELSEARRAEVEAHLATCVVCAAELQELRRLSSMLAPDPAESIPAGLMDRLHEQVDEWTDSSVLRFAQLLSGIAAVLLIGVGGWLMAAPRMPVEVAPGWERAAVTLRPEPPGASGSIQTAEWMVTQLGPQR